MEHTEYMDLLDAEIEIQTIADVIAKAAIRYARIAELQAFDAVATAMAEVEDLEIYGCSCLDGCVQVLGKLRNARRLADSARSAVSAAHSAARESGTAALRRGLPAMEVYRAALDAAVEAYGPAYCRQLTWLQSEDGIKCLETLED